MHTLSKPPVRRGASPEGRGGQPLGGGQFGGGGGEVGGMGLGADCAFARATYVGGHGVGNNGWPTGFAGAPRHCSPRLSGRAACWATQAPCSR